MKLLSLLVATLVSLPVLARADAPAFDGPPGASVDASPMLAMEPPPVELAALPPGPGARGPRGPRGAKNAALRQMILQRFDRNRDGRLEPGERRQAVRALRRLARQLARQGKPGARQHRRQLQGVIDRYDLNGDGVVGPGEMAPVMADRLRPLDRNGDGWVDNADFGR